MRFKPRFVGERVKLESLVKASSERNKDLHCADVYSVTNSRGFVPSEDYFSKEVYSKELKTYRVVRRGMLAYNPSRINIGSVALQKDMPEVVVSPLYVVFQVDRDRILPDYMLHFLKSGPGIQQILFQSTGTVRNNLKFNALCRMEMSVPSIDEQTRRVDLLEAVLGQIDLAKTVEEKLNQLVKSRFVEMFGDPRTNSQERPTIPFSEVVTFQRGFDLPVNDRDSAGNVPVYGSNGILGTHSVAKVTGPGVITGRSGTIGKVECSQEDYWPLNTALFSKDLHGNNVVYLRQMVELFDLTRFVNGAGVPTLNRNLFHPEPLMVVPLNEQQEFADFVAQVDKSRFVGHANGMLIRWLKSR